MNKNNRKKASAQSTRETDRQTNKGGWRGLTEFPQTLKIHCKTVMHVHDIIRIPIGHTKESGF